LPYLLFKKPRASYEALGFLSFIPFILFLERLPANKSHTYHSIDRWLNSLSFDYATYLVLQCLCNRQYLESMGYETWLVFFLGMMMAILLYNTVQWGLYRERIYGLYTAYLLTWRLHNLL
jgi:hypothetical protein